MKAKIPSAPGWEVVFAFGSIYNAIIYQAWLIASCCAAVAVVIFFVKKINKY